MVVQCSVGRPIRLSPLDTIPPWGCHNRMSSEYDDDDPMFLDVEVPLPMGDLDPSPRTRFQDMCYPVSLAPSMVDESRTQDVSGISTVTENGYQSGSGSPPTPCWRTSSVSSSSPSPPPTTSAYVPQAAANLLKPLPGSEKIESSPLPSSTPTTLPAPISSRPSPRLSHKRRRSLSDVDGADTAELSVKKRRLRLHLITSRLSRPFSHPATHILNREAIAGLPGDGKRFVKLAAYLSARRAAASAAQNTNINHNPSSVDLLRRAAILNRVRVGVVKASVAAANHIYSHTHSNLVHGVGPGANTPAIVAYHGMQLVNAARYFFPSPTTPVPPAPRHQSMGPAVTSQWHQHHTPNHVHAAPGPPPMSQHYGALLPKIAPPGAETATCQTPPGRIQEVEYHHAKLPPSPKLKPSPGLGNRRIGPSPLARSPDLRPTRERDFDEDDEVDNDSVAFPGSELDSRYADDSDEDGGEQDGYDFGAIFGSSARGGGGMSPTPDDLDELEFGMLDDQPDDANEHFYEQYLDELDGIPRGSTRI